MRYDTKLTLQKQSDLDLASSPQSHHTNQFRGTRHKEFSINLTRLFETQQISMIIHAYSIRVSVCRVHDIDAKCNSVMFTTLHCKAIIIPGKERQQEKYVMMGFLVTSLGVTQAIKVFRSLEQQDIR